MRLLQEIHLIIPLRRQSRVTLDPRVLLIVLYLVRPLDHQLEFVRHPRLSKQSRRLHRR